MWSVSLTIISLRGGTETGCREVKINKELTSSVYFFGDTKILAPAAKLFGKQADYEYYNALSEEIKQAVNDKFCNRETGIYAEGSQTGLSVPLQWKIVPEELIGKSGS